MLVDANLLLYAVDSESPQNSRARPWLQSVLTGTRRVALPWQSLGTFLRVVTHPRIMADPFTPDRAAAEVQQWLASPVAWIPSAGAATASILGDLVRRHGLTGNLVPDAQLAALAIEHGLVVMSADSDFARFDGVRWVNPLR